MRPVLLIDGRSGSGKTELAGAIATDNPHAQLVRLDDIYPGWGGLASGSSHVSEHVLAENRWRRWDWEAGAPAEWNDLDPARPLIVEGCGALSRASSALATTTVWVELEATTRKRRALDRDGELYAPHWDEWASQEDDFLAREDPIALARLVIRGDAPIDLARWRAVLEPARVDA